jgi:DNA-binding XRE family transcriptional regulator
MNLPGISARELFESVWRDNPEIACAEAAMGSRLTLARNVLRLRVGGGLTRNQLAQRLGISHSRVARIEAAQANVTIDTLDRIAAAFAVQAATLFEPRSRGHTEPAGVSG